SWLSKASPHPDPDATGKHINQSPHHLSYSGEGHTKSPKRQKQQLLGQMLLRQSFRIHDQIHAAPIVARFLPTLSEMTLAYRHSTAFPGMECHFERLCESSMSSLHINRLPLTWQIPVRRVKLTGRIYSVQRGANPVAYFARLGLGLAFPPDVLRATAARMSALNAPASTSSPSW